MFSLDGYHALRRARAAVRRGDRGVLRVAGSDRLSWLQGLLTNDVLNLPTGGACEAAYLTPQGRMITDARVIALEDAVLLDVPAPLAPALTARLDALLFAEDARVEDVSARLALIEVHGPTAGELLPVLQSHSPEGIAAVVRHDAFALPGVAAFVAHPHVEAFVALLRDRGAEETTLQTLDVVRIEAGRPAFLVDMDEHTIPLEAGIEDRAISFSKGCYVGQEVIVRVLHRGQGRVARKLVGLAFGGSDAPAAGSVIHAGDREIGRVTSAAWSPALERAIGLGYVHRDFLAPGTEVDVIVPAGRVHAVVAALPFVGHRANSDAGQP